MSAFRYRRARALRLSPCPVRWWVRSTAATLGREATRPLAVEACPGKGRRMGRNGRVYTMETMSLAPGIRFLPRLLATMRGTLAESKNSLRRFDCSSTDVGGTPITCGSFRATHQAKRSISARVRRHQTTQFGNRDPPRLRLRPMSPRVVAERGWAVVRKRLRCVLERTGVCQVALADRAGR